ncbi:MAG TPA: hypothetical protein VLE74_01660 [Candidatus Saccharimonadales bacterium]|nr:hypothetical protein [Candidatus Saccharimonadales bacterium]
MDNPNPIDQTTERLKQATNVLVTVSANPSVDQLAGAIGITLLLNKLGKHATAVFSGQIPDTIEFLQPEKTLEKNTDSLRDFIIALDKSKADKLRYKVEDQMVKIFITPYRTSISDKDLEFSQGDFNVEVVLALGVNEQADIDQAITAHGRILHDATVIGINTQGGANLGTINWVQPDASSLCQMLVDLGQSLKADVLDGQMATAFLTGIVAETERFSNEKTSAAAMQMSAKLMAVGANQQLVASQLEPPATDKSTNSQPIEEDAELPEVTPETEAPAESEPEPEPEEQENQAAGDGALEIDHGDPKPFEEDEESTEDRLKQIAIDNQGQLKHLTEEEEKRQKENQYLPQSPDTTEQQDTSALKLQPPSRGGTLTANTQPEGLDPTVDPLTAPSDDKPLLSHDAPSAQQAAEPPQQQPVPPSSFPAENTQQTNIDDVPEPPTTLSDLEKVVDSPHVQTSGEPDGTAAPDGGVNAARDAVQEAVQSSTPQVLEPIQALNAQHVDLNPPVEPSEKPADTIPPPTTNLPAGLVPPDPGLPSDNTAAPAADASAPPAVPPPMMPPIMPPSQPMQDPNSPSNQAL